MSHIKNNIQEIKNKIQSYSPNIQLVAVSKFQSVESILEAYNSGIRDFGENYIQEWLKKSEQLSYLKDIRWHLIGNLQKNKIKYLNEYVYCLQSLDSVSLAKEIEKKWNYDIPLQVMIQLQVDKNDINKSGVSFENSKELFEFIVNSKKLKIIGFMGIGPNLTDTQKLLYLYKEFVTQCYYLWNLKFSPSTQPIISLGMSQDLEIALRAGSHMLRIGTALFGQRG
jgi:pyridoxal phosphate enzyme (YggS family)